MGFPQPNTEDALPVEMGRADRLLSMVETTISHVAAFFILLLMLTGVLQIMLRGFWNLPIRGYIDYVELTMAVIAFAAVGYAERLRAHIRMDFLPNALSGRAKILIEAFTTAIALIAVSMLVYATWFSFLRTWRLGDSTMDIGAPIWPAKFLLFLALALLWLRLSFSLAGFAVAFHRTRRR